MLDRFGLQHDRRWMVVDEHGQFITQRTRPAMALIHVEPLPGGVRLQHLQHKAGAVETLVEVMRPDSPPRLTVKVWGDTMAAVDAGDEAASWLTLQLGVSCRLVYMPDTTHRLVNPSYASAEETVSFADAYPLLLISEASLADLNDRLENKVPMNRFRPNLVVGGCDAFAEDAWQRICIGGVELDVAKPCPRCVMPSIDQATAEKDSKILSVLAGYRRGDDGKTYFGQNLLYQTLGELKVGDEVRVVE